jgi:hypothetical protein
MIRSLFAVALVVAALFGCASNKTPAPTAPKRTSASTKAPPPTVRPVYPVSGRVALVNDQARFIIIDFSTGRPPELGQKLSLYRAGLKVAEVKVSGPFRNTTVAADLTAGEAKYGDEVKSD